ncbi:MAG: integrase [Candidatus Brocadia sp. WS118]|nr:MAG: integrase [Candidatus Brocadia sp. WS118]
MSQLREDMLRAMKLRAFSERTQESYVSAVSSLARYYQRSPDQITFREIEDYLLYLQEERGLAHSSCNLAIAGLKFFYREVLGRDDLYFEIPRRKKVSTLPEILSGEELSRLFACAASPRDRALLMTTYSGGLRVSEVVSLKISDIHSDRMLIRIRQGKGRKDRDTLLSMRLLEELRLYWRLYRPPVWLFTGRDGKDHLSVEAAQSAYNKARRRAGITRGNGIHTLRHCFATHLLEAGVDIRTIQMLMGHKTIQTTLIYLQVTEKNLSHTARRLDLLEIPSSKRSILSEVKRVR